MKYSIFLPVRDGGDFIKECVGSILSQSYQEFELIVLENASTDDTLSWISSIDDQRIKVFPSGRSLSIQENWGRIVAIPKNEFMTMIGHDDVLEKNYLQAIDALIKKHPDASLFQTHFKYIDSKGAVIRRCKPMDERQTAPEFLARFLNNSIDSMGTGYMMRSKDYDELGGMPHYPNLLFADFELWINLAKKSYKATSAEDGFSFRLHQSMTTTSVDARFQAAFQQFLEYLLQLKQSDQFKTTIERYALEFIGSYCKGLSHRLLRTPIKKRPGLSVNKFIGICKDYADKLVPGNNFDPYKQKGLRLAEFIDSNALTRSLFLLFKKIYSKPIY